VTEDSQSSTKERVRTLLLDGRTVTEIARALGVSKPTVCFHKRSLGIDTDLAGSPLRQRPQAEPVPPETASHQGPSEASALRRVRPI
jgi:Bacterial regulatory proteins, luxR family